jgi:transcriptional regulator of acetoin/glycerol metabolism
VHAEIVNDWDLACAARVNLLLMGREDATRTFVDTLRPSLRAPVLTVRAGESLALVAPDKVGTMILCDICAFGLADQRRLLVWLEDADGGTQVISTTSMPMVPLMDAGAFLEALYYRLNTVCCKLPGVS